MHPLPASAKVAPGPRSPAGRRALLHGGEKLLWLPPASHMSLEVAMGGLEQGISSVCFKAERTPLPDTHTHTHTPHPCLKAGGGHQELSPGREYCGGNSKMKEDGGGGKAAGLWGNPRLCWVTSRLLGAGLVARLGQLLL